ncbi:MAG: ATP-dependent DNA helicase [Clostridia bacterium]|nr:ATP-dependent DNA helicase [Clostridia bacterium]
MQVDRQSGAITVSVAELISRLPRPDDLGRRAAPRITPEQAAGMHRRLAEASGPGFVPAAELTHRCQFSGMEFRITGIADGIITDEAGITVAEVKPLRSRDYYAAQPDRTPSLLCLAYFYAEAHDMPFINTQLTYYNPDRDEMRHTVRTYAREQLAQTFLSILSCFSRWAELAIDRETRRLPAIREAGFPYGKFRAGQDELALAVFRAIRRGERLFAQAPTGIGKTMSTLYPAVKALGEGKCDRIFYLTAKGSTAREAWAAARRLAQNGAPVRTVMISAKVQMCLCAQAKADSGRLSAYCNPVDCPYAAGYGDRAPDAVYALLAGGLGATAAMIREMGERHTVCPYELSLDLAEHCELIICDYNYLFDPHVYFRRFFGDERAVQARNVFLIDEAHNLPDRARSMYSADLRCGKFERLYARVPAEERELDAMLGDVIRAMRRQRRLCRAELHDDGEGHAVGGVIRSSLDRGLQAVFAEFTSRAEDWLREHRGHDAGRDLDELLAQVRDLLALGELADAHFRYCIEFSAEDVRLRLLCLDPAPMLAARLALGQAAVFFSATLTPTEYFADLLGGGAADVTLSLPSPYPPEHLCLAAVDGVSTRYADREESVPQIIRCIAAAVSVKAGHYMVYFPSYSYMEAVFAGFTAKYPQVPVLAQKRGMDAAAREKFISAFSAPDGRLLVGFCVLGGSFSEGVDLPGRALIGTVVVGIGMPQLSVERGLLAEYYQEKCEQGHAYAYTYPGMNKVLQAAGRVIRREDDRGIVVLIDDRWAEPTYARLFPPHWHGMRFVGDAVALRELVRRFWAGEGPRKEKN